MLTSEREREREGEREDLPMLDSSLTIIYVNARDPNYNIGKKKQKGAFFRCIIDNGKLLNLRVYSSSSSSSLLFNLESYRYIRGEFFGNISHLALHN